jgi:hypothetical protein
MNPFRVATVRCSRSHLSLTYRRCAAITLVEGAMGDAAFAVLPFDFAQGRL